MESQASGVARTPDRAAKGAASVMVRSKVTNGTRVFAAGGDGRSAWTRRWRDLFRQHIADLGGEEALSAAEISLCRRAAAIEVQLELLESRMSEGDMSPETGDLHGRLSGHLRRLFEVLGVKRRAKTVKAPATAALHAHFDVEASP